MSKPKKLKVYGWNSFHKGVQVHIIVAAKSWAEASRISGDKVSHMSTYGAITGNAGEISTATAKPGTMFYVSTNSRHRTDCEYTELVRGERGGHLDDV